LLLERYDKCETKRDIRQSYIALPNEAARHKLLDVVGDLALITKIQGKVIANKPGHFVNTQFAKKMAKIIKIEQRNYVLFLT
jgi:UDP-3-O-acyl-N-acetylglucosamine deacetylase